MIRNIVFDMGQVLIRWDHKTLMDRLHIATRDRKAFARETVQSVDWVQMDRGTITPEECAARMRRRLPPRLHDRVDNLALGWWKNPLTPVEGMGELIAELKGVGYGIYLLSNASSDLHKYFHRIPGSEHFDGLVVSADHKQLKPEREIYQTLFSTFDLDPAACFFIDDLHLNIEGARFAGMDGTVFRGDINALRKALREAGVPVSLP